MEVDVIKTAVVTGDGAAKVCKVVGRCDRLSSDECRWWSGYPWAEGLKLGLGPVDMWPHFLRLFVKYK